MADAGGSIEGRTLEYTPTWMVAAICGIIIFISFVAKAVLNRFDKRQTEKKRHNDPIQKVKEELMMLGSVTLVLVALQSILGKVCIPRHLASKMLPCKNAGLSPTAATVTHSLSTSFPPGGRRLFAETSSTDHCGQKGMVPFFSVEILHQLHIFIFVLAAFHVAVSGLLMVVKNRQWNKWQKLIESLHSNDTSESLNKKLTDDNSPSECSNKLTNGNSPAEASNRKSADASSSSKSLDELTDAAMKSIEEAFNGMTDAEMKAFQRRACCALCTTCCCCCVMTPVCLPLQLLVLLLSFCLRQLLASVTMKDYAVHLKKTILSKGNQQFDFSVRIEEEKGNLMDLLEIRWYLWLYVVVIFLLNVAGWHAYFWISFSPIIILLGVGMSLENMFRELTKKGAKHRENKVKKKMKKHFWLIHIALFQNSFELAFIIFIFVQYGPHSCLLGENKYVIPRLIIGALVLLICNNSSLPLYTFVKIQMNLSEKGETIEDDIEKAKTNNNKAPGIKDSALESNIC